MILCFQLCGNSLGNALSCFSMTMPTCIKRVPYRNGLLRSVWKNLTGLRRTLTSTPSNTFRMNWNADCGSNRPTRVHDLTNALAAEWKQCANIQWKDFPEEWRLFQQQRWDQLHNFEMRCSTSKCPHTFVDMQRSSSLNLHLQISVIPCLRHALSHPVK